MLVLNTEYILKTGIIFERSFFLNITVQTLGSVAQRRNVWNIWSEKPHKLKYILLEKYVFYSLCI